MMLFRSGSEAERTAVIEGPKRREWRGGRRGGRDGDERGSQVVATSEHHRARGSCLCWQPTVQYTLRPQYSIKSPQASRISFSPRYPSSGIASPATTLLPSCHLYRHTSHQLSHVPILSRTGLACGKNNTKVIACSSYVVAACISQRDLSTNLLNDTGSMRVCSYHKTLHNITPSKTIPHPDLVLLCRPDILYTNNPCKVLSGG